MDRPPRRSVAVTGSAGRLGRAILASAGRPTFSWNRADFDLDEADSLVALLHRDHPDLVIHAAAMTNVDACARDPKTAMRRNAGATAALAQACRSLGTGLVMVSTNEVFDGERCDGPAYTENDVTAPRNPYGISKLAGEIAAQEAFDGGSGLWIARTAWLYGPPGADFCDKIVAAADRLPAGEPLPVVSDEYGSPTSVTDLAPAIMALTERSDGGVFHLTNTGSASRLDWARQVLASRRPDRPAREISGHEFERASDPPPCAVLDTTRAAALGIGLRDWQEALAAYLTG